MSKSIMDRHVYDLGPDGNHAVLLITDIHYNDGEPFITQELVLNSVGNVATISLCNAIMDPETLRNMADEIEEFIDKNKLVNEVIQE